MNRTTKTLCEGAILIAAALVLSYLKIPIGAVWGGFGGSIDFIMVPLIFFAVKAGWSWGIAAGFIFGTLKYFFAGGIAVNWQSILLDYSAAYAAVGFAGVFKGKKWGLIPGSAVGCLARFAVHFASGVTVYAQYMPEEFFNMTMTSTWVYSLLYNGSYMLPNTILAIVSCSFLEKPMSRYLNK